MNKIKTRTIFTILLVNLILSESKGQVDSIRTVTFSAVGDLMCHSTQFEWARVSPDSFDFKHNFEYVKPILESADITIGNLETVVNTKSTDYEGYPVFNTPVEYLEALKYSGFDILATANNHATDGRKQGVIETIKSIKSYGMEYAGTFLSHEDRDSLRIYNKNGISFTVLSYTYGVNINNLRSADDYMVNRIDTLQMKYDIEEYRKQGTDVIIVYIHAGSENAKEPTEYQKEIVNKLIEYGADVILSSSPHVMQPIDFFENTEGNIDTTLVAYSLGNFISNQRWRYSDGGVILSFTIRKNDSTGQIRLIESDYLPVWVFKGKTESGNRYIILPSESYQDSTALPFLGSKDIERMKEFHSDTQQILNKYSSKAKMNSLYDDTVSVTDTVNFSK